MPMISLGTWQSKPEELTSAVKYALKDVGYRHIDCAWLYGNEKAVGEGVRASGLARSEVFITSKVWGTFHINRVEECLDETLTNLGLDYLDLYLIHWPVAMNPKGNHPAFPTRPNGERDVIVQWKLSDTWKQMEEMVKKGKVKSIGVSNCSSLKLEEILPTAEIIPAVNQLELHLYNPELDLISYLKSKNIIPQAYSPLGSTKAPLLTNEVAAKIAKKHSVNISDVLLGYLLSSGCAIVPKSVNHSRIESNMKGALATAQKLDKHDLDELNNVAAGGKQQRFTMPPWGVDLGFDNWS